MNLYEAREMAWGLLKQHGLGDWGFRFDHARRRFGCCRVTVKEITLSRPLTVLNDVSAVKDTLLHEIAHALTPGDGHGPRWKAKCVEIGAAPVRCYTETSVVAPPRKAPPYEFGCGACQWWVARRRLTRRKYVCAKCRRVLEFRVRREEGSRV